MNDAIKKFKDVIALNHVSIKFERGKIHGAIGRNGSGKTVLFKCICGFMKLDSGEILLEGEKVKLTAPQNIGIIIENPGFIGSMSGYKNLKLLASIHKRAGDSEIREALQKVGRVLPGCNRNYPSEFQYHKQWMNTFLLIFADRKPSKIR